MTAVTPPQSLATSAAFAFVIVAVLDASLRDRLRGSAQWLRALLPLVPLAAVLVATWGTPGIAPVRGLVGAVALGAGSALLVFPSAAPVHRRVLAALLSIGAVAVAYTLAGLPPAWARYRADTEDGCLMGLRGPLPDEPPSQADRVAYCRCTTAPVLDGCWSVDLTWRFGKTEECVTRRFERVVASGERLALGDRCAAQHLGDGSRALYAAHARGLLAQGVQAGLQDVARREGAGAKAPDARQRAFMECMLGAVLERCPDKTFVGYARCMDLDTFRGLDDLQRECAAAAFGR